MDRDKAGEGKPVLHCPYGGGSRVGSQVDLWVVTLVAGVDRAERQRRERDEQVAVGKVGAERSGGIDHGVGCEELTQRKPVLGVDIVEVRRLEQLYCFGLSIRISDGRCGVDRWDGYRAEYGRGAQRERGT